MVKKNVGVAVPRCRDRFAHPDLVRVELGAVERARVGVREGKVERRTGKKRGNSREKKEERQRRVWRSKD